MYAVGGEWSTLSDEFCVIFCVRTLIGSVVVVVAVAVAVAVVVVVNQLLVK